MDDFDRWSNRFSGLTSGQIAVLASGAVLDGVQNVIPRIFGKVQVGLVPPRVYVELASRTTTNLAAAMFRERVGGHAGPLCGAC